MFIYNNQGGSNVTRLFINLFFIIIICFSLAIMPINTDVLSFFNLNDILTSEEPDETNQQEEIDNSFVATYTTDFSVSGDKRIYNPKNYTLTLNTNIPKINQESFDFDDMKLTLYKDTTISQEFSFAEFITNYEISYVNDFVQVVYDINIDSNHLGLLRDGFYTAGISFISEDKSSALGESKFDVAYRNDIDYVNAANTQNNGNFIYKAYYLDEAETHLVPLYFSVQYPKSVTLEVRNQLYNVPPADSGLSQSPIIPNKSSVSKIAKDHYGIFMNSDEISKVIGDSEKANLTISSFVNTLTRLPHISKLSFFIDNAQVQGSLFDIDLSKVYEQQAQAYAYVTEPTSAGLSYLVPVAVNEDNIYDKFGSIINILKSGEAENRLWTEIIPPEVEVNDFVIDGTTVTIDFNKAFLTAYEDFEEYRTLMINSILFSMTSIENITKVVFTVNGQSITSIGEFDLSQPLDAPAYINFIGNY